MCVSVSQSVTGYDGAHVYVCMYVCICMRVCAYVCVIVHWCLYVDGREKQCGRGWGRDDDEDRVDEYKLKILMPAC